MMVVERAVQRILRRVFIFSVKEMNRKQEVVREGVARFEYAEAGRAIARFAVSWECVLHSLPPGPDN